MSSITTPLPTVTAGRQAALRAADGVVAGYIRSLAHAAAQPAAGRGNKPRLTRLAARTRGCGAGRGDAGRSAGHGAATADRRRASLRPAAAAA